MDKIFVDVDVQNDFCIPEGALYVKGSPNDRFRELTSFAAAHRIPILGSVDSHAWDAWEFASSATHGPGGARPNFPDHCVKGTRGWLKVEGTLPPRFRFIPNVNDMPDEQIERVVAEIREGSTNAIYFEKEVYSLFANPLAERFLGALIKDRSATELFVYGVATDYCVKAAALGLAERGFRTALVTDAVAGITPEGTTEALAAMKAAGVRLVRTSEILS